MPTLNITKETGGKTLSTLMTIVAPEQAMSLDLLKTFAADAKGNGLFLADLLSAFTAHERNGVFMYRCVADKTQNKSWKAKYQEFGKQTLNHVQILEDTVKQMGGDPMFVSAAARLTEGMTSKMMETILLTGSADPLTQEIVCLEAVLTAEMKCHANWELIGKLADQMPDSRAKEALKKAFERVEPEEDQHVEWAETTWQNELLTRSLKK